MVLANKGGSKATPPAVAVPLTNSAFAASAQPPDPMARRRIGQQGKAAELSEQDAMTGERWAMIAGLCSDYTNRPTCAKGQTER